MKYCKNSSRTHLASQSLLRILPLLPAILVGLRADAISEKDLLLQGERPRVQQTLGLMQAGWRPDPLINATHLPKIQNKGVPELQNDFQTWYTEVLRGGPAMIACFEKAFPGATWAFIGRDTAPLADFFESFYLSLGQKGRVARIPMSSGTLASLQPEATLSLLAKNGLDVSNLASLKHPYVFVDAVSRKGGTQGRYLLDTIFKNYEGNHATLLHYVNFIGLRVSTTEIPHLDACNAYQILNSKPYRTLAQKSVFDPRLVLTYQDHREAHRFVGVNEAGYTHWVGAWHGPYGEVHQTYAGDWTLPNLGVPSGMVERKYVLDYQAHLILAGHAPSVLKAVQLTAQKYGYTFPVARPTYIAAPNLHLKETLAAAKTLRGVSDALAAYHQYNMGRSNFTGMSKTIIDAVNQVNLIEQSGVNLNDEANSYLDTLNWCLPADRDAFIQGTLATFFALDPKVEVINRLMPLLEHQGGLKRFVAAEALNHFNLKPTEQAVLDYQALDRPTERVHGQDQYTLAEALFKKNHLKKSWSLKTLFSKKGRK